MKKLLLILLCLPMLTLSQQNLIPNGDFEFGPDSTSVGWCCKTNNTCAIFGSVAGPDDWMLIAQTPDRLVEGDISCDWDNDTAQSGRAFIDFVYNERGGAILTSPLELDSIYQLSYYASWQTFQGASTSPSRVQFSFNNGGNSILTPYINTIQWTYYQTTFVAISNSTEIEIQGIENVIGGVNLDNISLKKVITGCIDISACNYNPLANVDDSTCVYTVLSYDTVVAISNYNWLSYNLTTSGDYSDTLISSVGCDSIFNLNLTITDHTGILNVNNKKTLFKITNMLGQESLYRKNTPLFYIYDDGTVEKRIVIE